MNNQDRRPSLLGVFWWLFPAALLFYLCLTKHPPEVHIQMRGLDKAEHFSACFLLSLWYFKSRKNKRQLVVIAAVLMGIGILVEYLQALVGRDFDYRDMVADGMGICTGLIFYRYTPIHIPINWIKTQLGVRF